MGRFDPWVEVYCQNDEVSTDGTCRCTVDGAVPDLPLVDPSGTLQMSTLARASPDILNDLVFTRFAPDYD